MDFVAIIVEDNDHFVKQRYLLDICNSDVLFFFCGMDWSFKYYLDELRL